MSQKSLFLQTKQVELNNILNEYNTQKDVNESKTDLKSKLLILNYALLDSI